MTIRRGNSNVRRRRSALGVAWLVVWATLVGSCVGWHIPNPPATVRGDASARANGFLSMSSDTCANDAAAAPDAAQPASCDNARTGVTGESDCGAVVDSVTADGSDAEPNDADPSAGDDGAAPTDTAISDAATDDAGDPNQAPDAGFPQVPLVP